ncbi:UNVERIFIED_CONTAM: putative LRR receptor-like serine/threonine-protein kinase [Sesamum calycinum]|uniref:non-specific serine/threonine protein kinase n=1 Tax=Sesamum calycinum TaxID=2727403 RepID=A0AAW2QNH9_9LAMI
MHSSVIRNNETDYEALLAFKAATNDPLHSLESWNSSIHFCRWKGVTCGSRHERVIRLNLVNQNLTGFISPHIGNLSFLRFLSLNNNSYSGNLPPELGRLKRLQSLSVSYNLIGGQIPASLSNCTELSSIIISYNKLAGPLPPELGLLPRLELIAFSKNNISGSIPSTFGNLSSLMRLYGGSNDLTGEIPDSLGRLKKLELLAFGENRLTGFVPPTIFNLSYINTFDLAANELEGTLPSYLGTTLPNLQTFSVGINLFSGTIPVSLSNATNLVYLHVGYNRFSGKVPSLVKLNKLGVLALSGNLLGKGESDELSFLSSLVNATSLVSLGLDDNNFGGQLPVSFWNLSTTLSRLFLTRNQITGTIPSEIGNFVSLLDLRVNDNRFTGMVPYSIGKLRNLQFLDFSRNIFSSNIPSSIGNLSLLLAMYLSENNLSSGMPSSLGNCQNLLELNLSQNALTGPVPREVLSIPSLRTVDLSQNQLNGTLPVEIGSLKNLEYFNVSGNNFAGEVPSTLGGCVRLEFLDMEENSLQGNIPSSFSSLRGLQVLDLSSNKLDGEIPSFLGEFNLLALNLSFNDFEGALPEDGIFKNASLISVSGNPKLCGGIPELKLSKCRLKQHKKSSLSLTSKIVISTFGVILGISMILGVLIVYFLKREKKEPPSNPFGRSLLNVSYQSLLQATGGFSRDSLLGVGSYGSVYKGTLEEKLVAIKVLNLSQRGALKSFMAECEALRNIRHRNLAKVLTACSGVDLQGNDFKALVYEYMPNGSLHDWLHPQLDKDLTRGELRYLNLVQRLNIAIDIACAVEYLHLQSGTPIIHCDLKPSNVLLDDEFVGHVGDFGLARFLSKATDSFSKHQTSSSLVRGTIGYTAPEYGTGSEPSTLGDVYSFGILLLEMFTGKRPTGAMFKDGFGLRSFVQNSLPDRLSDIADPELLHERETGTEPSTNGLQHYSSIGNHKYEKCLVKVLSVGVACSADSAKERMSIAEAVNELKSSRDALLRNANYGDEM